MQWDDFGAYPGNDDWSAGSWSPSDYAMSGTFGSYVDPVVGAGSGGGPSGQGPLYGGDFGGNGITPTPFVPANSDLYTQAGSANGLGAGLQQGLGAIGGVPSLLGLGGGLAGLIGKLASGGVTGTASPVQNTAAKGAQASMNSQLGNAAQGNTPLQQMQMSLLQSLASGQGLPPGYAQLVEQAFQPQMGDLYTQAANMGRSRGFQDAPATSPPGGAILGPGLSNIQGQMAAAKLGLMQSLPGLYNTPIGQQQNALNASAMGLQNTATANTQQQASQPLGSQIGAAIGSGLQGLGQSIQQSQNPNSFETALRNLQNSGMGITISGTPPKPFAKGGIVTKPTNAIIGEAGPEAVVPLQGVHPGVIAALHRAMNGPALTARHMGLGLTQRTPAGAMNGRP